MHIDLVAAGDGREAIAQMPPQVIIGLVVLIVIVLLHLRPRPASLPRLFIAPTIVFAVGLIALAPYAEQLAHPTAADLVFLIIDVVLTLVMSVARAVSIRLEAAPPTATRSTAWYRYGLATLLLWAVSLAVKVALSAVGHASGIAEGLVTGSVLAILGLSVVAQNIVLLIRSRARRTLAAPRPPDRAGRPQPGGAAGET